MFITCICMCTCDQENAGSSEEQQAVGKRPLVSSAEKGDILSQSGGSLSDGDKYELMLRKLRIL